MRTCSPTAEGGKSVEGTWSYLGPDEQLDLYDTIEWIADQDWCTGRVGMIGQSYFGVAQWLAGIQNPPHLACIAPYDARVDQYRDAVYHGGIPAMGYPLSWSFGLRHNHIYGPPGPGSNKRIETDLFSAILEHPLDDDFWRVRSPYWRLEECRVPVFSIGNWGKNSLHLRGNILGWERASGPKRLLVEEAGEPVRLGVVRAQHDFDQPDFHERVLLPWYDRWLMNDGSAAGIEPRVEVFVSGLGQSRSFDEWPPPAATMRDFFLDGGKSEFPQSLNCGRLSMVPPAGPFSASSYSYPQPEWHSGPVEVLRDGKVDLFGRTLTWSSDVLPEDVHVIGNAEAVIYLRSTEDDADVFVKLWDVQDAGYFKLVSRGWLRASHRELNSELSAPGRPFHDHRAEVPIPSDTFVELRIEVWPLAHCFQAGHRICLQLANCDSPITDANYTHYYGLKVGTDEIGHSPSLESRLVLPVVGESSPLT